MLFTILVRYRTINKDAFSNTILISIFTCVDHLSKSHLLPVTRIHVYFVG